MTISNWFRTLPPALLLAPLLGLGGMGGAAPASAQVARIDQGSFAIFVAGEQVGTETFTVRRVGLGASASIVLQGTTRIGGVEIEPILETSADWVPVEYRRTVRGDREEVVQMLGDGRRYTAVTTTTAGEGEREFRPGVITVILDAEVAFLYHALAARPDADVVTVLHPDQGRQMRLRLEVVGAESFDLDGRGVPVRRLRLSAGEDVREVLVDDQNRVMAVEIPGRSWVARRLPG